MRVFARVGNRSLQVTIKSSTPANAWKHLTICEREVAGWFSGTSSNFASRVLIYLAYWAWLSWTPETNFILKVFMSKRPTSITANIPEPRSDSVICLALSRFWTVTTSNPDLKNYIPFALFPLHNPSQNPTKIVQARIWWLSGHELISRVEYIIICWDLLEIANQGLSPDHGVKSRIHDQISRSICASSLLFWQVWFASNHRHCLGASWLRERAEARHRMHDM